jgi:hypothetical protein
VYELDENLKPIKQKDAFSPLSVSTCRMLSEIAFLIEINFFVGSILGQPG